MALQAAQNSTLANALTPAQGKTAAPTQSGAGAIFAALLEKLNPANTLSSRPSDALASREPGPIAQQAQSAPDRRAARAVRDDSGDNSSATALASLQSLAPMPVQTPVIPAGDSPTPQPSDDDDTMVSDISNAPAPSTPQKSGNPFADLKNIDIKDLKGAIPQAAAPVKPGQPALPVMPGHDVDEDEEIAAIDAKGLDAKAAPDLPAAAKVAANAAQHLLRPATPAQATEAQIVKPEIKQDATNTDSGNGSTSGDQPKDDKSQQAAAPAAHVQADAQAVTAPQHAQAPVHTQPAAHADQQAADVKPITNVTAAAAAAAPTQTTQASQPAATIQVSQAAHVAAQPDIPSLAVNIAAKSKAGTNHFDIRLDPPELGRIEVHLSVDDAGKAQAHLSADKPQTLDLLQRDSSQLTRALKDSGVDLGNTGLSFSLRGQDRDGGNAQKSFSRGRALSVSAVTEASASSSAINSLSSDRLDIRV